MRHEKILLFAIAGLLAGPLPVKANTVVLAAYSVSGFSELGTPLNTVTNYNAPGQYGNAFGGDSFQLGAGISAFPIVSASTTSSDGNSVQGQIGLTYQVEVTGPTPFASIGIISQGSASASDADSTASSFVTIQYSGITGNNTITDNANSNAASPFDRTFNIDSFVEVATGVPIFVQMVATSESTCACINSVTTAMASVDPFFSSIQTNWMPAIIA